MTDSYRKDETKYVKFNEAIKKHGRNKFVCTRLAKVYENKEDAERFVYDTLVNLQANGRALNDSIIDPVRVECLQCHQQIRQHFLEKHQQLYCQVSAFQEINDLF